MDLCGEEKTTTGERGKTLTSAENQLHAPGSKYTACGGVSYIRYHTISTNADGMMYDQGSTKISSVSFQTISRKQQEKSDHSLKNFSQIVWNSKGSFCRSSAALFILQGDLLLSESKEIFQAGCQIRNTKTVHVPLKYTLSLTDSQLTYCPHAPHAPEILQLLGAAARSTAEHANTAGRQIPLNPLMRHGQMQWCLGLNTQKARANEKKGGSISWPCRMLTPTTITTRRAISEQLNSTSAKVSSHAAWQPQTTNDWDYSPMGFKSGNARIFGDTCKIPSP